MGSADSRNLEEQRTRFQRIFWDKVVRLTDFVFEANDGMSKADARANLGPYSDALVTATGTTTARTLANHKRDTPHLFDFVPTSEHSAILGRTSSNDVASEFQAFVDEIESSKLEGKLPPGRIILDSVITIDSPECGLFGAGFGTELRITHSLGAGLKVTEQLVALRDFRVTADSGRSGGAAGSNFGILFEPPDIAGESIARCLLDRITVADQPNHGLVMIGNAQLSKLTQCLTQDNKGHGYVFDIGTLTSRANVAAISIVTLDTCWGLDNLGHALVIGNPSDASTAGGVRFWIANFECDGNAQAAGTRHTADQCWIRGEHISILGSAFGGGANTGGIRASGKTHWYKNNRFVECTDSVSIGPDVVSDESKDFDIEQLRVITTAQDPAVIVEDTTKVSHVRVRTNIPGNITSLLTSGVPGSTAELNGPSFSTIRKTTNQTVNNSTTLVDDDALIYPLAANEDITFKAVIRFRGDASADIKFAFEGPTGVDIRWHPENSIKITTADAVVVSGGEETESSTDEWGAALTNRWAVFVGRINNGAAAGNFKFRFAQSSAVAADTIVGEGSYLQVFRETQ